MTPFRELKDLRRKEIGGPPLQRCLRDSCLLQKCQSEALNSYRLQKWFDQNDSVHRAVVSALREQDLWVPPQQQFDQLLFHHLPELQHGPNLSPQGRKFHLTCALN